MSEPFIGQIQMFGFNFPPRGWAHCDGQLLPIAQNTALFSLLGTTFGGDGRTTFGLPALRGRVPVHVGNGPGLQPITWGQKGGANTTTLTAQQLPPHSHTGTIKAKNGQPDESNPGGAYPASLTNSTEGYAESSSVNMADDVVQISNNGGGGQAHNNMQPFIGIYYSIALVGLFPSRS